jgi:thiosulfate reductase cytochrome b subunit
MRRLVPKHPLAIRWFHWLNVPLLALMIWSGLLIYWANPVYRIGWGDTTLVRMTVSQEVYRALQVNNRLARGMAWHFWLMWPFAVNGLLYVAYTAFSGEWRHLLPGRASLREAWQVLLHDLHLSKRAPPPRKFNGAQQIAYTSIVVMGLGSLLTGLAIYKPVQLGWLTALFGGYQQARFFHFWLTIGYVGFFVIHVAQVVRAGWNNFRAMVIGVEVVDEPAPAVPAPMAAPPSAVQEVSR